VVFLDSDSFQPSFHDVLYGSQRREVRQSRAQRRSLEPSTDDLMAGSLEQRSDGHHPGNFERRTEVMGSGDAGWQAEAFAGCRLDFKSEIEGGYAQTRHVPNITLPSLEDSVDDRIIPKCDDVLFKGNEDISAFLLKDRAL